MIEISIFFSVGTWMIRIRHAILRDGRPWLGPVTRPRKGINSADDSAVVGGRGDARRNVVCFIVAVDHLEDTVDYGVLRNASLAQHQRTEAETHLQ
jgi:hypothetical protein